MFGFALGVAARTHYFLRRFMPTNILLDALHTRRGLKWGAPAMLLVVPYCLAAVYCAGLVEAGGAGWLSALALLFVWNALKFLVAGPFTLMQLSRVRFHEERASRHVVGGTPSVHERLNRALGNVPRGEYKVNSWARGTGPPADAAAGKTAA